jgi:alkanesulfonate monooxygenase SsuD/methylene tetrahydromethanopterin reductase-like flavin-dependent oxidoreductase (luciferase family)
MPTATQNPRLRFGLWVDFRNPPQWRRPYKDLYAETLEMIAWAESIGYHDVWLSEHHFVDDGYSPAQMPIAAAIAVKTKKIRIGTSVVLLPMYDPVRWPRTAPPWTSFPTAVSSWARGWAIGPGNSRGWG